MRKTRRANSAYRGTYKSLPTLPKHTLLQREHIHFLRKVNNKAKARRSAKSLVLGKVKVMSYEDLKEARAKHAAKDAAKAKGKGKRGPKPKSPAPEVEEATTGKGKHGRRRKSPAPEADALEPKAKVA